MNKNELKKLDKQICDLKGIFVCELWHLASRLMKPTTYYKQCKHECCVPLAVYPPPYSSNIKWAWELFEEMINDHESYELMLRTDYCVIYQDCVMETKEISEASTAPEAIAKAYVKWKAETL